MAGKDPDGLSTRRAMLRPGWAALPRWRLPRCHRRTVLSIAPRSRLAIVDGYVAGVWRPVEAGIKATAFHRLSDEAWHRLQAEARANVPVL